MNYKLVLSDNLLSQLGNEGVIFLVEKNQYYSLNETMYKIVAGIDSNKSEKEIINSIIEEYDIEEYECEMEIREVVEELIRNGIVNKVYV